MFKQVSKYNMTDGLEIILGNVLWWDDDRRHAVFTLSELE